MDVAISVCLDIALIAVIAVFVAIGVRKGFLRSIIGIVGCIVAVIVAVSFSSGVGEKINDKFVHEPVRKWVVNQLTPDPGNVESSEDEINFDELFEEQPSFFTDFCGYVNVGVDKLKEIYDNYVAESVESAREHVIDAMATPLASSLSRVIAFAVLFVGTWIVIGLIWLVLSFFLHVPVIRKFDKLGGGLLGFVRGVLIALILAAVVSAVSPYIMKDRSLAEKDAIYNRTVVYKVLCKVNPLIKTLD